MYNKCVVCGKYFRPDESKYKEYCSEKHRQEHNKQTKKKMIQPVKKYATVADRLCT